MSVLDRTEVVGVFTNAIDLLDHQSLGATVMSDVRATYVVGTETVQGVTVQGAGYGTDPTQGAAALRIVTGPASDLVLTYEGLGRQLKYGNFRIGRVSTPPPVVDWFEFSNDVGSKFLDVAATIAEVNTRVTIDSGRFANCTTGSDCVAGGGFFTLIQDRDVGALRFSSNSLQSYVVEMPFIDRNERIGIFTETFERPGRGIVASSVEIVGTQSSGADVYSWIDDYSGTDRAVTGIVVQGSGQGLDPRSGAGTIQVITEPATDLILQYEGMAGLKFGKFRLGRVVTGVTSVGPPISLGGFYANQGIAVDQENGRYFGATANKITRFDTDWSHPQTDAMIRDNGNAVPVLTDIQQGTATTIAVPQVDHFGAIDYRDGYLWVGLLESRTADLNSGRQSAIAKIDARTLELRQVWNLADEAIRLSLPEFTFRGIDPVAFDGTHLWVGSSNGIFRFTLSGTDGDQELAAVAVVNYHPQYLGEPEGGNDAILISQGIRVVGDRLYAVFPSFAGVPFAHSPATGLYEFAIPRDGDGWNSSPRLPTRVWHLPQENGQHLEGFDFVPGTTDEIYLTYSGGRTVDRLRLAGLDATDSLAMARPLGIWRNPRPADDGSRISASSTCVVCCNKEIAAVAPTNPREFLLWMREPPRATVISPAGRPRVTDALFQNEVILTELLSETPLRWLPVTPWRE